MTNSERLQANNTRLQNCVDKANTLPDAGGEATPTQEKTVSIKVNGSVEVLPDDGYALSKVVANVDVPIPEGYIQPSGTKEITENGTHDVTEYASVNVNVVGSGENHLDDLLDGSVTEINSNVSKIVAYACYGITALKTVNLPNATTSGGYSFRGCSGLTSFNAPNLATIGSYMFYGCSSLTEVNFPKATSVSSTSFYQCTKLKKADFGVAKSISSSAFAYCTQLEILILRRSDAIVTVTTNGFDGVTTFKGYVYVPKALIEDYENYTNWATKFSGKFRAIEDYPEICGG